MICKRVGRKEWKDLKVGETGIFTLPNEKAVEAARSAAQAVKKLESYELERIRVKDPLTIAFKRIR